MTTGAGGTKSLTAMIFVLVVVGIVMGLAVYAVNQGFKAHDIAIMGFISFGTIIVLFAAAVLYNIGNGSIQLRGIISEPVDGPQDYDDQTSGEGVAMTRPKASLSRFQFLIFTFVVAGLFLMLSIEAGRMVDIPTNVLVLIGLSGTGFLAGKSLSGNTAPSAPTPAEQLKAAEEKAKRAEEAAAKATKELEEAKKAAGTP